MLSPVMASSTYNNMEEPWAPEWPPHLQTFMAKVEQDFLESQDLEPLCGGG